MSLSSATACALWCPEYFNKAAVIDFWLNHPAVPAEAAAKTRAALPKFLSARVAKCWLNLYFFLEAARTAGPRADQAQVLALLEELRESGVVEKEERLELKPKLLRSTQAEFDWHAARIRKAVEYRQHELQAQHEAAA
ncbi:hypothetical protein [Hymenobacter cellulosivorans]|uniref:Uncharacterized protein n=1 Tax=Hymenobacter cellulosivorans TaxID=2932249 RepID=A0ABY4FA78_9BACT|nr:hypothetical protein [Hymenobacter cellulosivorans]UOQ53086.1 hypothetical protein MUN80_25530 [Hymenobacter cellulosivorans]